MGQLKGVLVLIYTYCLVLYRYPEGMTLLLDQTGRSLEILESSFSDTFRTKFFCYYDI